MQWDRLPLGIGLCWWVAGMGHLLDIYGSFFCIYSIALDILSISSLLLGSKPAQNLETKNNYFICS